VTSIGQYAKFIMALLGTIATAITTQFPSTAHWLPAVLSAVSALLVVFVPNASKKTAKV
jgi:hypothetical protein